MKMRNILCMLLISAHSFISTQPPETNTAEPDLCTCITIDILGGADEGEIEEEALDAAPRGEAEIQHHDTVYSSLREVALSMTLSLTSLAISASVYSLFFCDENIQTGAKSDLCTVLENTF